MLCLRGMLFKNPLSMLCNPQIILLNFSSWIKPSRMMPPSQHRAVQQYSKIAATVVFAAKHWTGFEQTGADVYHRSNHFRVLSQTKHSQYSVRIILSTFSNLKKKKKNLAGHPPSDCSTEWSPRTIAARCPCCAPPTHLRCTTPSMRSGSPRSSPANLGARGVDNKYERQ